MLWLTVSAFVCAAGAATWFSLLLLRERRLLREQLAKLGADHQFERDQSGWDGLGSRIEAVRADRDQFQEQAREAEARLHAILASLNDGVAVIDGRRVVQLANDALLRLFGLKLSPVGQSVLTALRLPECEQIVADALASGTAQTREVAHAQPGLAAPRHLALYAAPLQDGSGVLAVFRDVSQLKQFEQVRREFVSNVSHELRTPLSIFQGYVEMLLDSPNLTREELLQSLQVMQKHSLRLKALVEDLLVLTRLESDREQLELTEIRLADLLDEVAADWAPKVKSAAVELSVSKAEALPTMRADRRRLEQVLNNLIENALKHTPSGGNIRLCAEARGEHLELRVEDSGSGIPAADLPHIFERFYRVDKARSREQGGTGLGLSIVKHLVQAHGGTVHARSTLGRGTAIILSLPLSAPARLATT